METKISMADLKTLICKLCKSGTEIFVSMRTHKSNILLEAKCYYSGVSSIFVTRYNSHFYFAIEERPEKSIQGVQNLCQLQQPCKTESSG